MPQRHFPTEHYDLWWRDWSPHVQTYWLWTILSEDCRRSSRCGKSIKIFFLHTCIHIYLSNMYIIIRDFVLCTRVKMDTYPQVHVIINGISSFILDFFPYNHLSSNNFSCRVCPRICNYRYFWNGSASKWYFCRILPDFESPSFSSFSIFPNVTDIWCLGLCALCILLGRHEPILTYASNDSPVFLRHFVDFTTRRFRTVLAGTTYISIYAPLFLSFKSCVHILWAVDHP